MESRVPSDETERMLGKIEVGTCRYILFVMGVSYTTW